MSLLTRATKALSFRAKTLPEFVKEATTQERGTERYRKAIWGIRLLAEQQQNVDALVKHGVIKVMVSVLEAGSPEQKLWALYVIRLLADNEMGASLVLQEPNAIETLVGAVAEANVGSESAKRAVETFKGLSQHMSTQILLAREDVFSSMVAAMQAAPAEASAALFVYATLSEVNGGGELPVYGKVMASEKALATLQVISQNSAFSSSDRDLAKKTASHLSGKISP